MNKPKNMPRLYTCNKTGTSKDYQNEHETLVKDLGSGLYFLLRKSYGIGAQIINIRENPDKDWMTPTTKLYNYDGHGFIVTDYNFEWVDLNAYFNNFKVKAFPTRDSQILIPRLDGLMKELGFKKISRRTSEYLNEMSKI
jgi:hypothetical protein